jgi:hypothetical protein
MNPETRPGSGSAYSGLVKHTILMTALAITLVPAMAQAAIPQPIYFWSNVALTIRTPGQPAQAEVIRPSTIVLSADGSWGLEHLHWTGWGSSVAHAKGISSASNGIPNMAQGKRIKQSAQITLSSPGRFYGHEVYRCYALKVPAPGNKPTRVPD